MPKGWIIAIAIERTVIKIAADGGKDAAFFPDLPDDQWDIEIEAEINAASDVPGLSL